MIRRLNTCLLFCYLNVSGQIRLRTNKYAGDVWKSSQDLVTPEICCNKTVSLGHIKYDERCLGFNSKLVNNG